MNNRSSNKGNTGGKVESDPPTSERIAKRMARAGLCSRREAETWIEAGRVKVNGKLLKTPAFTVTMNDRVEVDDKLIAGRERTRLWLFHKPGGVVTTNKDPEGRKTVFEILPQELPRVMSVGRLDINTEGLLLFTNDGGLARVLELPSTGWLRRYRVRAHGKVTQQELDRLKDGIAVEGVLYGAIDAEIEHVQGTNTWFSVALREGKNREIKKVFAALGLSVNRLIRISYGPFQLGDLPTGVAREIRSRTLREQLGEKLVKEANADFDAPIINLTPEIPRSEKKAADQGGKTKRARTAKPKPGTANHKVLDRLTTKPKPSGKPGGKRDGKPTAPRSKKRGAPPAKKRSRS